jgi:polyisoprenoid-binding protein YceI
MHMKKTAAAITLPALALVVVASRRQSDAATTETAPAAVAQAASRAVALPATDGLQLVVAQEGNQARYRIREQLVGVDLPNDAVGATSEVSGGIAFDGAGKLVPASSRFIVNVGTLKSDKDRRDGYVRGRILETNQYPTVELTPTAIRGLTLPLPTSGNKTFQIVGELTVHGVTKPTTWNVTATFDKGRVSGAAATSFLFSDFGLNQPRVPVVLSVADSIKLEYTFSLVPKQ